MYLVAKNISFSYGHRLLKHKGKCARLHGHNAVAEIHCASSKLNANAMVVDFDDIKKALKTWIEDTLDHRMILNRADVLAPMLKKIREPFYEMNGEPTAEAIAKLIFDRAHQKGLPVTKVVLWETSNSCAVYSR